MVTISNFIWSLTAQNWMQVDARNIDAFLALAPPLVKKLERMVTTTTVSIIKQIEAFDEVFSVLFLLGLFCLQHYETHFELCIKQIQELFTSRPWSVYDVLGGMFEWRKSNAGEQLITAGQTGNCLYVVSNKCMT
jgi:hypothetical protein